MCFSLLCNVLFTQTVCELRIRITENKVPVEYKALLLRTERGEGFIRLAGPAKQGKASVYDLEWGPYWGNDAWQWDYAEQKLYYPYTNDSFLLCHARFIRTVSGYSNSQLSELKIWFRKNSNTGIYEPHTGNIPFSATAVERQAGSGLRAVMPMVNPSPGQVGFPAGEQNSVVSFIKHSQGTRSKKNLLPYFTAEELGNREWISPAQLLWARERFKPSFYLLMVHSGEKLCREDAEATRIYFQDLCRFMNIPFRQIIFKDNDFNVKTITRKIQSLTPRKNDIILFAYAGHGFSYMEDEPYRFPQLALWHGLTAKREFIRANTINLEEIYQLILAKNARLSIVTGDCCNSYIDMRRQHTIPTLPGVFGPRDKSWNHKHIADLFLDNSQSLLMAAAGKGEVAASHSWYGGFFTFHLLESVNEALLGRLEGGAGWDNILQKTGNDAYEVSMRFPCREARCGQHMISKKGN